VLDQQARGLVGVQGRLQVDLGAGALLAEAVHGQMPGSPGAGAQEGQAVASAGHGASYEETGNRRIKGRGPAAVKFVGQKAEKRCLTA
jgi:hypothetical protein